MNKAKWIGWTVTLGGVGALMAMILGRVQDVQEARANPEVVTLPSPAVRVEPLVRAAQERVERATGEVAARAVVQVFPRVGGRVLTRMKDIGDTVEAGELLMTLEEGDLGWRVRQGEAGLGAARAGVRQAAVQVDLAKTELRRAERLHKDKALSRADLERAEGGVRSAEAALGAARAQVGVAEAGLGLAEETRGWTEIRAPIAGIVTKRMAEVGNMVGPQGAVYEIQDQARLELHVSVAAPIARRLAEGAEARALIDGAAGPAEGYPLTVKATGPSLDPMTRRVRVELLLPEGAREDGVLPHMVGHLRVSLPAAETALVAPASSVVHLQEGPSVFVIRDGRAHRVDVLQATTGANTVPVRVGEGEGAAREGDRVVTEGQAGLKPEVEVKVIARASGGEESPR